MQNTRVILFFILALTLCVQTALGAATQIESASLVTAESKVQEWAKLFGKEQVLLVLDIDNTLLTSNQDLGGDTWWNLQDELLKKKHEGKLTPVESRYLAGNSLEELLEIAGMLFHLGHMHSPEETSPALVKRIQEQGIATLALTSRGPEFSNITFREMSRNLYDFKSSAIGPMGGYPSTFLPYEIEKPQESGIKAEELTAWGLKKARPVKYENGIYFTSGQHKGAMLRALLAKVGRNFKGIVFADDGKKNTDRMVQGFEKVEGVELLAIRYSKVDPIVERIRNESKDRMRSQLVRMKKLIEELFPLKPHPENL